MRVMIRTLKDLFKWWLCDSLWWTITSVLPTYIMMSVLMKNNNMIDKYNTNVLPIYNNAEYNFNILKYI